ncbi:UNVERIFIED_CONTAM: hypothetical protein GTU68_051901 [Idotea baltica]|nr:hypothetical protein [Idotea baltica]
MRRFGSSWKTAMRSSHITAGKDAAKNRIRVLAGDKVQVEMTPYDLTRVGSTTAFIYFKKKNKGKKKKKKEKKIKKKKKKKEKKKKKKGGGGVSAVPSVFVLGSRETPDGRELLGFGHWCRTNSSSPHIDRDPAIRPNCPAPYWPAIGKGKRPRRMEVWRGRDCLCAADTTRCPWAADFGGNPKTWPKAAEVLVKLGGATPSGDPRPLRLRRLDGIWGT